jgi:hypothetical protein
MGASLDMISKETLTNIGVRVRGPASRATR